MQEIYCNEIIARALKVAARCHQGDSRKESKTPYIVHPVEVAMILQNHFDDEELIAAGLLHDTLEDTGLTKEELRKLFNDRIVRLVLGASERLENLEKTPWKKRKKHTIESVKDAEQDIKYLVCADKLANIRSMIRDKKSLGDRLWDKFNAGYDCQKWYYHNMTASLKALEGKKIYQEFTEAVSYLFEDDC